MFPPRPRAPVSNVLAPMLATEVATKHAIISYKRQHNISYLPTSTLMSPAVSQVPIGFNGLYARGVWMRVG